MIVVGTIVILFKAIPLISDVSKPIGEKHQEKELFEVEEKNNEEMSTI